MATISLSANLQAKALSSANLTVVDRIAPADIILAQHFNDICGRTLLAASSAALAKAKAGYLWGKGYGDRGYGQTTNVLAPTKAAGQTIAQEWNLLRTVINDLANWQITNIGMLPSSSALNSGASIAASIPMAFSSALSAVDARRLSFDIANMTLTANVVQSTRATTWGTSSTGIECVFQTQFASEEAARFFFNTGGSFRISLDHPDVSTQRNISWNTALKNFNMSFSAHGTKMLAGNFGTAVSIGYYELTSTYQTIVDGTDTGISIYNSNDFILQARSIDIVGLDGAVGKTLQFRIFLFNDSITSPLDAVASGTTASLSHLRATTGFVIAAPSCSIITGF